MFLTFRYQQSVSSLYCGREGSKLHPWKKLGFTVNRATAMPQLSPSSGERPVVDFWLNCSLKTNLCLFRSLPPPCPFTPGWRAESVPCDKDRPLRCAEQGFRTTPVLTGAAQGSLHLSLCLSLSFPETGSAFAQLHLNAESSRLQIPRPKVDHVEAASVNDVSVWGFSLRNFWKWRKKGHLTST